MPEGTFYKLYSPKKKSYKHKAINEKGNLILHMVQTR